MGIKRNEGQLFRLYGSIDMRAESRVRVGDIGDKRYEWVSEVWPIRNRDLIISSWRDIRFEEDHGVGVFLIKRILVRGCVC